MLIKNIESKIQRIPKLRFPGFKGEWEEKRLEKMFIKIRNGFVGIATPFYVSDGIPYLQGKNIKNGHIISDGLIHVSRMFHERQSNSQLNTDDILMVQSGHSGECAVVDQKYSGGNCHALLVMTPNKGEINPYFIKDIFYSEIGKKIICKITTGNTIQHVLASDVGKIIVNIPVLQEQQKIAEFLESIDKIIDNLRTQKESLESYKKGIMQKIFSQEIRFKDENGNEFPKWEEKRLGEIFYSEKGEGLSKDDIVSDGASECILYGELYTTYKEVIFKIKSHTNSKCGLESKIGDLLIPCSTTTVGIDLANVTALNKEGVLLGGDITVLRSNNKISNIFYAYYLSNYKKHEIARYAQGSTIVHLYYNHLSKMMIGVPNYEEQQKIADFLTSLDKVIESKGQQMTQAEQWKKGLIMQQLFV